MEFEGSPKSTNLFVRKGKSSIDLIPFPPGPESDSRKSTLKHGKLSTSGKILKKLNNAKGRKEFSTRSGISEANLLEIANAADFLRVKGLGTDYIRLLNASGIRTVRELRTRNPRSLHKKLLEVNRLQGIVIFPPGIEHVKNFIEEAKTLELLITY